MIIYKTINTINNKIYIGKDSRNNPNYLGSGKLLKKAIVKYGKESFVKEILGFYNSIEELNNAEIKFIELFNSLSPNGYNLAKGGEGGNTRLGFSEDQKLKYSLNRSIAINKAYAKYNFSVNPFHNKSEEELKILKKKWSDCKKGKLNASAKYFNKILQKDKSGNIIKIWDDIYQIRNESDFTPAYILNCCNKKKNYNSHKGFIWEFID